MSKGVLKRNEMIIEAIELKVNEEEKEKSKLSNSPKIKNESPKIPSVLEEGKNLAIENFSLHQNNIEDERSHLILTNNESIDMMKSELKTEEIGLDTLSLIDQIDLMSSLNSSFYNKRGIFKFIAANFSFKIINV
jgi:hypothetical protein